VSLIEIETVALEVPLATVGPLAVMDEAVAFDDPAMNVTRAGRELPGYLTATVFVSALVDLIEQVESPLASVLEQALTILFEPVMTRVGTTPTLATPFCFTLTETVELATPSARMFEVAVRVVT
jgi:hypothetical protein